jgi:hypothetical protein
MSIITISMDSGSLILNDYTFKSFAEGDYLALTPVNAHTSRVNSADGGVTIGERMDKDVYDLTFSVQKYSDDDVFMLSQINTPGATLFEGSAKESYAKDGSAGVESWNLDGGSITTLPTQTRNNQDGNAMMEYTIQFRTAKRSL